MKINTAVESGAQKSCASDREKIVLTWRGLGEECGVCDALQFGKFQESGMETNCDLHTIPQPNILELQNFRVLFLNARLFF